VHVRGLIYEIIQGSTVNKTQKHKKTGFCSLQTPRVTEKQWQAQCDPELIYNAAADDLLSLYDRIK